MDRAACETVGTSGYVRAMMTLTEEEMTWGWPQVRDAKATESCQHEDFALPSTEQGLSSFQFSSVAQSCPILCNPMNRSTPVLPVHHQVPEFTQTHVHWVGDAIQPSHPLSSPSPPALKSFPASGSFPTSQLFASGGQSIEVSASTSVLPMNTQDWSSLGWTGWISLQSKGLSRVFSNTTVQKHQFFATQLSSQSSSHIPTWPLEKP